jgi:hypothetical protein
MSKRAEFVWAEFEPGDRLVCETPEKLHGLSRHGQTWMHTPFILVRGRWKAEAARPIDQELALRMLSGRFEMLPSAAQIDQASRQAEAGHAPRHAFAVCKPGGTKILSRHRKEDMARGAFRRREKAGEPVELWRTEKGRPVEKLS